MLFVRDIMERNVLTLSRGTTLAQAARELGDRGVSGAPVCDTDGRVVGILSKTDLTDAFVAAREELVEDVMYPEVLSTSPDDPIDDAVRKMAFEGVHRLVVFDHEGQLVGIVTSMDVLRGLAGIPRRSDRVIAIAP